ncbi:MAG: hypothetical protein GEEBNDBF_01840 [bacterium]|nr:hypothetical protein [bacterium]
MRPAIPTDPMTWCLWGSLMLAWGVTLSRVLRPGTADLTSASERPNPTRKLVHLSLGSLVVLLWLPDSWNWVAPLLWSLGFLIGWLVLPHPRFARLSRLRGGPVAGPTDVGIVAYPTVMLTASLLLPPIGGALLLVYLAIGDGLAALIGGSGQSPLPWNPRKRWRGFWAFVGGAGTVASLLLLLTQARLLPTSTPAFVAGPVPVALGMALVLALMESLPVRLDDNLGIALGFVCCWYWIVV